MMWSYFLMVLVFLRHLVHFFHFSNWFSLSRCFSDSTVCSASLSNKLSVPKNQNEFHLSNNCSPVMSYYGRALWSKPLSLVRRPKVRWTRVYVLSLCCPQKYRPVVTIRSFRQDTVAGAEFVAMPFDLAVVGSVFLCQ